MPKLIAANWKENPRSEKQAIELYRATAKAAQNKAARKSEVAVCPPFVYLEKLAELHRRSKQSRVALGAQDVFWEEKGPYTSEVGPKMLKSLGVKYVIVGHSERRKWLKETDAMINKKIKLALKDGLRVILCVGEGLAVRKTGAGAAVKFVQKQLKKDLAGVTKDERRRLVIAYEPIWAIGTGRYDKPEDAAEMAAAIKRHFGKGGGSGVRGKAQAMPRVLYGGSVHSSNAADYIQYKQIDGALVGGASLRAGEFKKIIAAAAGKSVKQ